MTETSLNLETWQGARLPQPIVLTGQWVRLEPLDAAAHTPALWQAVLGHDEVWDWLADGPYDAEAGLAESVAAKAAGASARFYAIIPEGARGAAGYASLMRIDAPNGVIEVGNVLFSPALQRTRAATETIYLLARYIFDELGYRRFEWKCNAQNLPSRRAAGRFGFTCEGIFRQHMVIKGKNRDTAWYSILDSEWPKQKRAFEAWLAPANFDPAGRQLSALQP
jgi:RimJ/RimL family protein N-acetyltransferase